MLDPLLNILLPAWCVLCDARVEHWSSGALCPACEGKLQPEHGPWCPRCGLQSPAIESLCGRCLAGATRFDFARSALVLDPALRRIIHHFKYNDRVSLARPLGRALRECLDREPFQAETVIPVPLHRKRERERGYNQAGLLAERLGLRTRPDILRRTRNTESQTGLTRAQRVVNVRGAFECRRRIEGAVLVVDDVQTTGATANAVARALRRGGASRVEILTLTRARGARDSGIDRAASRSEGE